MMKRIAMWMATCMLACAAGAASAEDVVIGPGDVLHILVYGNPDLTTDARVATSGNITFPLLGQVNLTGLSAVAAETKIGGLLEKGGFLKKAQVSIMVTMLQSQLVSVLGSVARPGRYPIDGKRSLMDILALAGGIGADGGDTVSLIRKRDGVTTKETIDVGEMVRKGDLDRDIDVSANDVLYVERAPRFYIYGEVQHAGMMRLERSMTVLQALSAAGGLSARGTERGIRIKRRNNAGKIETIDTKPDDLVLNDDVVYVKESWF